MKMMALLGSNFLVNAFGDLVYDLFIIWLNYAVCFYALRFAVLTLWIWFTEQVFLWIQGGFTGVLCEFGQKEAWSNYYIQVFVSSAWCHTQVFLLGSHVGYDLLSLFGLSFSNKFTRGGKTE